MKIAIHQLHYFPWLGYFHKMASVDKFIIMDDVQLTDNSYMFRHKLLTLNGIQKYITISFQKKDYMQKTYNQLLINQTINWQKQHSNFIRENYKRSPFFDEIWEKILFVFEKKYTYLQEVTLDTVILFKNILGISTELIMQSNLNYPKDSKRNQLVLDLCLSAGAKCYLSGNGARKYMEVDSFIAKGIEVKFQQFTPPAYEQFSSPGQFIAGLSILDMMFNIGIEETRIIFNKLIEDAHVDI